MNGFLVTARFAFLRMARSVTALVAFLGLPLFIIPLLSGIFSGVAAGSPYLKGAPTALSFFAIAMLLMFQLFGGSFSMQSVTVFFLTPRKWRIHALPCRPVTMVLGILAASTVLSLAQGLLISAVAILALGARMGSIVVLVPVILGIALLSQLIGLTLLLAVRNPAGAFALGWIVAYGCSVLGGMVFPLPAGSAFFRFTQDWGSPFSIAQNALLESMRGDDPGLVALRIATLFAVSALLGCVVALLARRKLA